MSKTESAVILNGSPRPNGNTAALINIAENALTNVGLGI